MAEESVLQTSQAEIQETKGEVQITAGQEEESKDKSGESAQEVAIDVPLDVTAQNNKEMLEMLSKYKAEVVQSVTDNLKVNTGKIQRIETPTQNSSMNDLRATLDKVTKNQIIGYELSEDSALNKHIRSEVKNLDANETQVYIDKAKSFFSKMQEDALPEEIKLQKLRSKPTKDELDKMALCNDLFPDNSKVKVVKW